MSFPRLGFATSNDDSESELGDVERERRTSAEDSVGDVELERRTSAEDSVGDVERERRTSSKHSVGGSTGTGSGGGVPMVRPTKF